MDGVFAAAQLAGWPDDALHREYFSVPEGPERENHPFVLELADGRLFDVPADRSAADVLADAGVKVDVKCSDGLCGVCACACAYDPDTSDPVDHRSGARGSSCAARARRGWAG